MIDSPHTQQMDSSCEAVTETGNLIGKDGLVSTVDPGPAKGEG